MLRRAGVERIVVVLGYRADEVMTTIKSRDLPVEVVVNADWESGTASSVLIGLSRVGDRRCLVVMGDHVYEADDVRRLMQTPAGNVAAVDRSRPTRHRPERRSRPNRVRLRRRRVGGRTRTRP